MMLMIINVNRVQSKVFIGKHPRKSDGFGRKTDKFFRGYSADCWCWGPYCGLHDNQQSLQG